jgi:hypothetical protein
VEVVGEGDGGSKFGSLPSPPSSCKLPLFFLHNGDGNCQDLFPLAAIHETACPPEIRC